MLDFDVHGVVAEGSGGSEADAGLRPELLSFELQLGLSTDEVSKPDVASDVDPSGA